MIAIAAVDHIGIRVADEARAVAFYRLFGFEVTMRATNGDPVVILRNATDVEINLIVNAVPSAEPSNILMDAPEKYAGYTHVALRVGSLEATQGALATAGIPLSGKPVRLGNGVSLFIRDPDRNVVELREKDSGSAHGK
ncbi:MAG TPA: VOC family protein [Polyangiaceae bacterium]|jgi:lactoylglutathione lyase|nr:VOC family protein [Polyangiaceae bacterium]